MSQSTEFKKYIEIVCSNIRWKKAHETVSKELLNHLIDQKNAYINKGISETEAEKLSIKEFGDPYDIGIQLDSAYKPKKDIVITLTILAIFIIGFVSQYIFLDTDKSIISALITIPLGFLVFLAAYYFDYSLINKYFKYIYIIYIIGLFSIIFLSNLGGYVLGIFSRINGKISNINYLFMIFPVLYSCIIHKMHNKGFLGIIICGISIIPAILLSLFIPSLSMLIFVSVIGLVLLTYSIFKNWFNKNKLADMLIIYIPTIFFIIITYLNNYYIRTRLNSVINPYQDITGAGYVPYTIRNIISHCKFIGKGTGNLNLEAIVPELDTNFILTNLMYNYGIIVLVILIFLISIVLYRGFKIISQQKNMLGKFTGISIISIYAFQTVSNILSNLGFSLFYDYAIPFFSGNSSIILNLFLLGILLSVFRNTDILADSLIDNTNQQKLFEIIDGKIIIYLKQKA